MKMSKIEDFWACSEISDFWHIDLDLIKELVDKALKDTDVI